MWRTVAKFVVPVGIGLVVVKEAKVHLNSEGDSHQVFDLSELNI